MLVMALVCVLGLANGFFSDQFAARGQNHSGDPRVATAPMKEMTGQVDRGLLSRTGRRNIFGPKCSRVAYALPGGPSCSPLGGSLSIRVVDSVD